MKICGHFLSILSIRLDTNETPSVCICVFFFFFFKRVFVVLCHTSGSCTLFTRPTSLFFSNFFIKNGLHSTIHTIKNYFTTVFSVFSFQQNKWYPNTPLLQTKKEDTNYHFFSTFQA